MTNAKMTFQSSFFEKGLRYQPLSCNRYDVDFFVAKIFGQAFFEKACAATVMPVDHTDYVVTGVFAQAFFEKGCGKAVF
ncbi:hypothetical protein [Methanosarcina barkeri]|uniref:hypothetical protein n=1 Tax=Methanosarcina barkeri TaxID=2208 RepID=UPI00064F4800|nr:hypothetical protein [Methanosarcina barkeri]